MLIHAAIKELLNKAMFSVTSPSCLEAALTAAALADEPGQAGSESTEDAMHLAKLIDDLSGSDLVRFKQIIKDDWPLSAHEGMSDAMSVMWDNLRATATEKYVSKMAAFKAAELLKAVEDAINLLYPTRWAKIVHSASQVGVLQHTSDSCSRSHAKCVCYDES